MAVKMTKQNKDVLVKIVKFCAEMQKSADYELGFSEDAPGKRTMVLTLYDESYEKPVEAAPEGPAEEAVEDEPPEITEVAGEKAAAEEIEGE